jgi:hypothetical protein
MSGLFDHKQLVIRKDIINLLGAKLQVMDSAGNSIMFSKMKAFKLKEDIRLFRDEDMQHELISIQARSIIDFSAAYDVTDSETGEKLGALRKRGFKSILKDEWVLLDNNDNEIGHIKEDSLFLALLRRFVANLIPQSYVVEMNGERVSTFKQNFNPFVVKLNLDFTEDRNEVLDKRLGIAAGLLLCVIEGKQE